MAEDDETQQCSNCKKPISKSNFTIHMVHCQRNFSVCNKCNDVFPVNQLQEHLETAHKNIKCQLCNLEFENYKIDEHESCCPKRLVQCVFCELEVRCDDLNDHENYCGSRTELCGVCNQYVMLRDQAAHEAAGHPPVDKKTNTNNNRFSPLRNDFTNDHVMTVPFVPKKANIETDLYTRQSPSKRNNDMPQVNTSFPLAWKAPEKTSINEVETDSGNLDRLLAFQLQEMQESNGIPELNDFLEHAQMLSDTLSTEPSPFNVNPDLVWSYRPLDEIFQNNPDFLNHDNFQTPPEPATESEDGLPCEFCGELYPADLLIQHESGCCPDIAHGLKREEFDDDVHQRENTFEPIDKITNNEITVAMLPCEHCGEVFPEEILLEHEEICLRNPEIAAEIFLRDLNAPIHPKPQPLRTFSNDSIKPSKPHVHQCPSLISTNKSVNRGSNPPADHKFGELTRSTSRNDRPGQIMSSVVRNVNEYSAPYLRRSSDTAQSHATVNPANLARRLSHLDKGQGENKNVNLSKPKPTKSNLYLQEMKNSLKRPQDSPNLVVTGAKPKSLSESGKPTATTKEGSPSSSGNYVPSYCRSNDGQLEATYRRFLAQQRANYGANAQQRPNVQPRLKQTGAVPKTTKKSSSEE